MKLKKTVQMLVIACGVLVLGACSGMRHGGSAYNPPDSTTAAENEAAARGAGYGDHFSDSAGSSAGHHLAADKTYYFDFDKSDIREEYRSAILANADWLVAHPDAKIILEGHTDPRGSREYNVALGERRANSVAELLKTRGVNPDQVRVVSYGMEKPAMPGHTETAFEKDRRAVIVIAQN